MESAAVRTLHFAYVLSAILLIAGCDGPVRIGIEAARAARVAPNPTNEAGSPEINRPGLIHRVAFAPARAGSGNIIAPPVPQPADPSQIVGLILQNDSDKPMPARAVRFGQVFVPGQVPATASIAAVSSAGKLPTQLDVKTTNADGSIRFAAITVIAPALAPGASLGLMLTRTAPASSAAIPLARLAEDTVAVDIKTNDGKQHHLDSGALARTAIAADKVTVWRKGPVATEARVDTHIEGSLHVIFDIAADAAGGTMTDIEFCNDYAMQPVGGTVNYDVAIRSSGKEVLSQGGIRQLQYTTWHTVVRSDDLPEPHIVHDPAYLLRTGALLNYDLKSGVDASFIGAETRQMAGSGFGILGNAGLATYMGSTGGRPDIAPITGANAAWVITQDRRAERYALAQADAAGSIPWHYYDVAHDRVLNLEDYPTIWTDSRGLTMGSHVGLPQPVYPFNDKGGQIDRFTTCSCFSLDGAHQPDLSFVPYLMTGGRYYLDQLMSQAAWNLVAAEPGTRQLGRGIVVTEGVGQVRGQAWALREIDNAAYILPDDNTLHSYFVRMRDNNYAYLQSQLPDLTKREGAAYGYSIATPAATSVAPWQQDYLGESVGQAASQGYAPARNVLRWLAHFLVGRFTSADDGFDPHDGVTYQLIVTNGTIAPQVFYQTWAEIDRKTNTVGLGYDDPAKWAKWAYPAYQQEALATVATIINVLDDPDARKAYAWLATNLPVKTGIGGRMPGFSIVPATTTEP